jgi:hypothetical protein
MTISAGSRYAQATVVTAQRTIPGLGVGTSAQKKDIAVIIPPQPADTVIQYQLHQVAGHETVDLLAARFYSDPTLWWQIANANPEILNWSVLAVGQLIRIPVINGLS